MNKTLLMRLMSADDSLRFWSKVNKSGGPAACWPWTEGAFPRGYGQFWAVGHTYRSHRVAYFFAYGEIGNNLVRHKCDNPPCCNPTHLELGSNDQNMEDMVIRGRAARKRGEEHSGVKLTEGQVMDIRSRLEAGETGLALSLEYQVHKMTISNIKTRKNWGWL